MLKYLEHIERVVEKSKNYCIVTLFVVKIRNRLKAILFSSEHTKNVNH